MARLSANRERRAFSRAAVPALLACAALAFAFTDLHPAAQSRSARGESVDSGAIVRAAENAQRRFERIRLEHMPYGPHGSTDPCDEAIGRFCYRYGSRSERSPEPPAEKREVKRARADVIRSLDSLTRLLPADEWMLGMLIHYRIEAEEHDRALEDLARCRGSAWWCSALSGYVFHSLGRHLDAESAFDRARAGMDSLSRCDWDDIAALLGPAGRRSYRALPCSERLRLSRSAWWLADPLFLMPGNDRRSEHDVRRLLDRLAARGVTPTWFRWGSDLTEILLRFGWPEHWSRFWRELLNPGASHNIITQYHREPSYHFIPSYAAITNPENAGESEWLLLPDYSNEEYSPPYASFGAVEHQTARFLRNGSMRVISAVNLASDTAFMRADSIVAGLLLSPGPEDPPIPYVEPRDSASFRIEAYVPESTWIASIEATSNRRHVARARFALPPLERNGFGRAISDLLVFDPRPASPKNLEGALEGMRSSLRTDRGANLGLYWEVYGVSPSDQLTVVLRTVPDESGFFRRLGEALRVVSRAPEVSLRWPETGDPGALISSRAMEVDVSRLARGWYTFELSVTVRDEPPLVARRRVEVTR